MARAKEPRQISIAERTAPAFPRLEVLTAPADGGNPYQRLLADALARRGATVVAANRLRLRDVLGARRRACIVHLHWIEFIIRSTDSGRWRGLLSVGRAVHLLLVLLVARIRRVRVVWTVHNLQPHEARRKRLDALATWLVARLADAVLVHSRHCAAKVSERWGRTVEVAYHGNYIDFYPPPRRDRRESRLSLGIPADAHVFLAFGLIRPYKMIVELIAEFRRLADPRFRLLIAGRPLSDDLRRQVEAAAAGDERVVLRLGRIADADVAEIHLAADVAVFAYRDVFSSGALMLALSHGLPVVAAEDSTASELGAPPAIRGFPAGGLGDALLASFPSGAAARERALGTAARYDWEAMATKVLGGGESLVGSP
ncbi:MAG TPA: glycosyltransferase family 4 protein [Solirubrobacterales bacterium]|nr:glycosyltransferase family 4 protein [Solirubrobacterales bacterium]